MFVLTKSSYSLAVMPFVFLWTGFLIRGIQVVFLQSPVFYNRSHGIIFERVLQWLPYVLSFLIFITILGSVKPFEMRSLSRPLYDKVVALNSLLPDRQIKMAGLYASTYRNYVGWDRVQIVQILPTTAAGSTNGKVGIQDIILQNQPDAIVIGKGLISSRNFDANSLAVLDTGWIEYPLGNEQLYLSPDIAQKPLQLPEGVTVSPEFEVILGTGWYDFEPNRNVRWMQGTGQIWIYADHETEALLRLKPYVMNVNNAFGSTGQLVISVNGATTDVLDVATETIYEVRLNLTPGYNEVVLGLAAGNFIPKESISGSTDERILGIAFYPIEIDVVQTQ
jgi:hypothetical protein